MSRLLTAITGVFAFASGGVLMLFFLPLVLLRNLHLHGTDYVLAAVGDALMPRPLVVAVFSLAMILAGIALGFTAAFPAPAEMRLGGRSRFVLFWSLALVGTAVAFCLLLAITLQNLRLD